MKIVAISMLSPLHQFVLATIHKKWPLECVVQPVRTERPKISTQCAKLARSPIKTIARRVRAGFYSWQGKQLDRAVAQAFAHVQHALPDDVRREAIENSEINSRDAAARIRQFEPDVIVTSGCPILTRKIFGIARLATINVHWGIAPAYRGENTIFWPLYYGDYDNLGVTIHQVDKGIDTGPILAHGYSELSPGDTEAVIISKSAQLAGDLLVDVLDSINQHQAVLGFSSEDRGQLFRDRDRSLRHEFTYWLKRRLGRRSVPLTTARRRIYANQPVVDGQFIFPVAGASCVPQSR